MWNFSNESLVKRWVPHDYQKAGIEWLIMHPAGALFWAPGLGKTAVTLDSFMRLRELGFKYRMLVLAPLRVCQTTWLNEYRKWDKFAHLKVGLAHGADKQQVLLDATNDIVIVNYDGLTWLAPMLMEDNPFQILVYDELTKVKHTNTKRFKTLKPLIRKFNFRWGLTGTPVSNGLMDLFGQIYALDEGAAFGKYITHFRLEYFTQHPYLEYKWDIRKDRLPSLYNKLRQVAQYIRPEDYLKLPDLLDIQLPVQLPPAIWRRYREFEESYLLDDKLTAANAGVLSGKLRQFLGGALYDESGEVYDIHTAKLDALDDLLEELAGEPLMVAYMFDHELERIRKRHPEALFIKGQMSRQTVQATMDAWNAGEAAILLVQPQAAAHGLNLQFGGSALCWFSLTYSLEDYIQLIGRLWRQGQESVVRNYMLAVPNSMDAHLAKALSAKDATQESVFQALLKKGVNLEKAAV
jgi:SNF2 family DNA or RNA helicase